MSLYKQGLYWYGALPAMKDEKARPLMRAFDALSRQQPAVMQLFGAI